MRPSAIMTLVLLASTLQFNSAHAQYATAPSRIWEIGIYPTARMLSTEYSVAKGRGAFGGSVTFGTFLRSVLAIQGGAGVTYSRQEFSYYRPPLFVFTPTISLILQRSVSADFQPYALAGGGYEFVRYTYPRCDCNQTRRLGIANVGAGFRKMIGDRSALRAEVSSQVRKGGASFTSFAGVSLLLGRSGRDDGLDRLRAPERVLTGPPRIPNPQTAPRPTSPPAVQPTTTPPGPRNPKANRVRPPGAPPLPTAVNATLLQFNGTQVDFSRPTWPTDAEVLLDGLVVDLTSDAGERIRISIEAHTDNVGSNAVNTLLGLDRARAVREYLVAQGVSRDRIRIRSAGGDAPIAPNTTAIGRQQNQRIVIRREN
jgi:outer membrane protein OmpA-like peptidoglycan-associated protein